MSLTATEEALVRQLLDRQAAILSLAGKEFAIISKLGATKVTLADLLAANSLADADLLLTRQGTTDKSVRADILAAYMAASSTFTNKYLAIPTMELTSVPTQKIAPIICVTQPHLRVMVWNGSQYVRAPWHQPCQLFFSYDNPASIPGALPVRADVSYQQSNYPDVVARLGLSGSGTFSLVESRGEFIRVLDNGRAIDSGRALRSSQSASRVLHSIFGGDGANHYGKVNAWWSDYIHIIAGNMESVTDYKTDQGGSLIAYQDNLTLNGYTGYPTVRHGDVRPRNIAFPLWMTI